MPDHTHSIHPVFTMTAGCPGCADLAVGRGEARQLGGLAVWEWRGQFWRYAADLDRLVPLIHPGSIAECRRFAEAIA